MNDIFQALQNFRSSGYKIDVVLGSKDDLSFQIKVEDDGKITLRKENRIICSITVTKTEGEGHVVFSLKDGREVKGLTEDLMEECRKIMKEELL